MNRVPHPELPVTDCPSWCVDQPHPWERDVAGYYRSHQSRDIAWPGARFTMHLRRAEFWSDGELHRAGVYVWVEGHLGLVVIDAADCLETLQGMP